MYGYHNLRRFGWAPGVHRSPHGYQHPWLVVTEGGTVGCWTRAEARQVWRESR